MYYLRGIFRYFGYLTQKELGNQNQTSSQKTRTHRDTISSVWHIHASKN
jgi:hypothetical protein